MSFLDQVEEFIDNCLEKIKSGDKAFNYSQIFAWIAEHQYNENIATSEAEQLTEYVRRAMQTHFNLIDIDTAFQQFRNS